jgi:hypothetical protein
MPEIPDGWELYKGKPDEPERCDICRRADDDLLFLDGWNLEDPGTGILVCDACMGWGHRTQLAAGYVAEDGL